MDLRDTRFRHAEDVADLLHGELLVVVERQHLSVSWRQRIDEPPERDAALVRLGCVERTTRRGISQSAHALGRRRIDTR